MIRCLLIGILLLCVPLHADDLSVLRARLLQEWLSAVDRTSVDEVLRSQKEDGSWPDIDYTRTEGTNWPHVRHLERASLLALTCRAMPDAPAASKTREAVAKAWEFWFARDFTNQNWWYNEIGVPRALAPGLVALSDELTQREREQGVRILQRARIQGESQNLVWLAEINALRGLVVNDAELVGRAYRRIGEEIRFVPSEGLQPDFSLLQHRRCLYNHGYGASFALDASRLARLLHSTQFALPPDRIELVESLLLDGSQWMGRGPWQDWAARGREIARIGRGLGLYQAEAAENLLSLEPASKRAQELRELVARVREQPDAHALEGARHFWRADFTVLQRKGIYASVRFFSDRVANTDFNGPENLLGHHLADGATTLMTRGGEYAAIFPTWNWQRIPGTTARQNPPLQAGKPRRDAGSRSFAGAACDGSNAMVAFDFERDGLTARKAWFLSDAGMVALGSGVSDSPAHHVVTTLNQCLARGPMATAPETATLQWVWQDGLAYLSLGRERLEHAVENRVGSWRRIHANLSDASVESRLFTIWIDHGKGPESAQYAYLIAPAEHAKAAAHLAAEPTVRILANTTEVQAVQQLSDGEIGVVFYEPGILLLPPPIGRKIQVDSPCVLLIGRNREGGVRLRVAEPTTRLKTIRLMMDQRALEVDLPVGAQAGSTVTVTHFP